MSKSTSNVVAFADPSVPKDPLTELIRQGAQQLLSQAIEIELEERMAELQQRRLDDGRQAVVRNGYHPERQIQTGIGPVTVQIPKIRARDGKPVVFRSALVPPYVRKSRSLEAALPWLYLKGVSSGEMSEALAALVGSEASGLSASTVARLKKDWGNEYDQWCKRRLDKDQWVYIWADGIYSGLRGTDSKLCALVIIGVNELGEKHFLAIEDGVRESKQSWRDVLLGLKDRGMSAPKLAVGDGAMGCSHPHWSIFGRRQHRDFKVTVAARVHNDPAFAQALLDEAITLFVNGEPESSKLILRDLDNTPWSSMATHRICRNCAI